MRLQEDNRHRSEMFCGLFLFSCQNLCLEKEGKSKSKSSKKCNRKGRWFLKIYMMGGESMSTSKSSKMERWIILFVVALVGGIITKLPISRTAIIQHLQQQWELRIHSSPSFWRPTGSWIRSFIFQAVFWQTAFHQSCWLWSPVSELV